MIKEKNAQSFNSLDAKKLRLWKVTLPIDNFDDALSKHQFEEDDLRPQGILGEVFSAPSHIQIIVKPSALGILSIAPAWPVPIILFSASVPSPVPPPSFQAVTNDVAELRKQFCTSHKSKAPLIGSQPRIFHHDQNRGIGLIFQ